MSSAKVQVGKRVTRKTFSFVIVADQYYKRSSRMLSTKYRFDTSGSVKAFFLFKSKNNSLSAKAVHPELHPEANSAIMTARFLPICAGPMSAITIYSTTHL